MRAMGVNQASAPGWEGSLVKQSMLHLSLLILITGCATAGNPAVMDQSIVSQIEIGKSTKADVRRLLGEPNSSSVFQTAGQEHESWGYAYAKHETNPWIFVPIVGLFVLAFGDAGESESANLGVSFDKEGIVRSITKGKSNAAFGGLTTPTAIQSHSTTQSEGFKSEQQINVPATRP